MNIYETLTMLEAVKRMPVKGTFLRDRYFPTAPEDIFETQKVVIDYEDEEKNRIAPFVLKHVGGIPVAREGYTTDMLEPPTIAPKRTLSIDQLDARIAGENIVGGLSPAERAAKYIASDIRYLNDRIDAAEEYMAAKVLTANEYTLDQYADKYGTTEKVQRTLKFYTEMSNPAVHTISTKWDQAGSDPIGDIATMAELLLKRGLPASDLIVGSVVADALLSNSKVLSLLDNRRYILTDELKPEELASGATFLVRLNAKGHLINVFSYTREYYDGSTDTPFIGAKQAVITAPGMGRTVYGAVTQIDHETRDYETYAARRVPQVIVDEEAGTRSLIMRAKPILLPKVRNSAIVAQATT